MKISSCIHIVANVKPPSCLYHATSLSLSEPLNLESVKQMLVAYVLVALSFCPAYLALLWPSICLPPTVLLCGHFSAPRRTVGQHPGELWHLLWCFVISLLLKLSPVSVMLFSPDCLFFLL